MVLDRRFVRNRNHPVHLHLWINTPSSVNPSLTSYESTLTATNTSLCYLKMLSFSLCFGNMSLYFWVTFTINWIDELWDKCMGTRPTWLFTRRFGWRVFTARCTFVFGEYAVSLAVLVDCGAVVSRCSRLCVCQYFGQYIHSGLDDLAFYFHLRMPHLITWKLVYSASKHVNSGLILWWSGPVSSNWPIIWQWFFVSLRI